MTSIVLLALIANTYFIQTDYSYQWETLGITAVAECSSVRYDSACRFGSVAVHFVTMGAHTRKAFISTAIFKRPRDGVIYNHMQHDKTVYRI